MRADARKDSLVNTLLESRHVTLRAQEWPDLAREVIEESGPELGITMLDYDRWRQLTVIGFVGSIDNDFCGTDFTIGTTNCFLDDFGVSA